MNRGGLVGQKRESGLSRAGHGNTPLTGRVPDTTNQTIWIDMGRIAKESETRMNSTGPDLARERLMERNLDREGGKRRPARGLCKRFDLCGGKSQEKDENRWSNRRDQ